MGKIWRNGKLIGQIGGGDSQMSGYEDDEDPYGFGCGVGTKEPKCRGKSQDFLSTDDFKDADPDDWSWALRADKRVYEHKQGLIKCLAPAKLVLDEPKVYVRDIDWASFPTLEDLTCLFYRFFSKYPDREVLVLVGKLKDGSGWLYLVPEQEGTGGSVNWVSNDKDMDWFQERATWVGTIHSHPGNYCQPSQTDIDDWAEPEKSGLHLVFGRDGSYTVNGAIAEKTFEVDTGKVPEEDDKSLALTYWLSKGRSLEELLKKPKPIVTSIVPHTMTRRYNPGGMEQWRDKEKTWADYSEDFLADTLETVGAISPESQDGGVPVLRVLEHKGELYVMTLSQYAELVEWCKGECPVPKTKRLKLYGTKGGG